MRIAALIMLLFCVSCGDNGLFDSDRWSDSVDWQPDFTVPLARGDYTLWDIMNQFDNDSVLVNDGNKLFIKYTEKDIFKLTAADMYTMPEQDIAFNAVFNLQEEFDNQPIPLPGNTLLIDVHFAKNIVQELTLPEGTQLEQLSGKLKFSYELPKLPFNYGVEATLMNVTNEFGNRVTFDVDSIRETVRGELDLSMADMDMSKEKNSIKLQVKVCIYKHQTVDPTLIPDFALKFRVYDVSFHSLAGKIPTQTVYIEEGSFKMSVDFWKYFNGEFNFVAPKLELVLKTEDVDIPVGLDMKMDAYGDDGRHAALVAAPLQFEGSGLMGIGRFEETLAYDTANSNIAALLSLPPKDFISYGGRALVNPDTSAIYIHKNARVSADVRITIPMNLSAQNLVFKDTIKDIDISGAEDIKRASITISAENSIPLALHAGNLLLLDENKICIDSVKVDQLLEAPVLNEAGEVTVPAKSSCKVDLTEKNISYLNQTKYIVIAVGAATSNDGQIPVELKPESRLILKLLLSAKLDLK